MTNSSWEDYLTINISWGNYGSVTQAMTNQQSWRPKRQQKGRPTTEDHPAKMVTVIPGAKMVILSAQMPWNAIDSRCLPCIPCCGLLEMHSP